MLTRRFIARRKSQRTTIITLRDVVSSAFQCGNEFRCVRSDSICDPVFFFIRNKEFQQLFCFNLLFWPSYPWAPKPCTCPIAKLRMPHIVKIPSQIIKAVFRFESHEMDRLLTQQSIVNIQFKHGLLLLHCSRSYSYSLDCTCAVAPTWVGRVWPKCGPSRRQRSLSHTTSFHLRLRYH